MKKITIAFALMLGVMGSAQAAGDAAAGKEKSTTCAACHGPDGNSFNPVWPKLAGQHPSYLAKQLAEFKAGERTDPTMAPMAMGLSEEDMADLAAYFASQSISTNAAGEAAKMARGKAIYMGGDAEKGIAACMACHGPTGAGNPAAKFPNLAGQHAAYAEKTLKDFRSGARANDLNKMMRDIAANMSDDDIAAVSAYLASM